MTKYYNNEAHSAEDENMQDFIVTWVDRLDNDRFRVFESLAEAEKFMDELANAVVDHRYIYDRRND